MTAIIRPPDHTGEILDEHLRAAGAVSGRLRTIVTAGLLAVAVLLVYAYRLAFAPIYLAHDEIVFALNAHSVARSLRGFEGTWLPVFFHITGGFWATPINIYLTAIVLKI